MGYRVVEIPGGSGNSKSKVNHHLEKALVELGKAMHYAEAEGSEGYYADRMPAMYGDRMPEMPGRFQGGDMNMRQPEGEHSEEYLRGWHDHEQMMNMRTRAMRGY